MKHTYEVVNMHSYQNSLLSQAKNVLELLLKLEVMLQVSRKVKEYGHLDAQLEVMLNIVLQTNLLFINLIKAYLLNRELP